MNFIFTYLKKYKIKKNNIIYIIIILFFIIKLLTIPFYKTIWWDSAVYIGIGKYIYSLGKAGLWEASRPIVWPLILGFLWKIGLNPILFGRIIEVLFGSLCILFTYLIGEKLFNKKIALLASIFLALSPTFFFFNGIMLTEIVSTFFALIAIYFLIIEKKFLSGIFFGISFMTRFLQLFVFIGCVLSILIYFNKKNFRNLQKIVIGFIVAIFPFLLLNQILYNNILFPFLQQIFLSNNSGWFNYRPISYYFIELFKENFLYSLSIFGVLLIFKSKDKEKMPILFAFFLFFLFFNLIKQKEIRFLIILFPFMYLLMSFSIIYIFNNSKSKIIKKMTLMFVVFSFFLSIIGISANYKSELKKNNQYHILQNELEKIDYNSKIWVSSPIIPIVSDKKIDKLIYYPVFNEEKKKELIEDAGKVDFIFIDSCDLSCKPSDTNCENNKIELISYLKQQLTAVYSSKTNSGMRVSEVNSLTTHCEQYIFRNNFFNS